MHAVLLLLLALPYFVQLAAALTSSQQSTSSPKHAFATLLCDDDTLPAIQVLANSIRIAGHVEPFLVIVPSSLSRSVVEIINGMEGAQVFEAASLQYPFNSTTDRMEINKPCRFLKLQLWGLIQWDKIVFLDADTIVKANVVELFEAPGFAAVKDPVGMNFNTGVIVIEPNRYVYSLIVNNYVHAGSYNVGDQGALNALVEYNSWTPLPMRYNTFHNAPKQAFDKAKIVHYSGDAKPWNFWKAKGRGRIGMRAFLEWCKAAKGTGLAECHMRGGVDETELLREIRPKYEDVSKEDGVSVLLSTYNRDSWKELALWYAGIEFVKEVVVVWQNFNRKREDAPHEKVRFVYPQSDSLNNRYLASGLQSDCVYICDDDIYLPLKTFRQGFEVWKQNAARLVGYYPRLWEMSPAQYLIDISNGYNVVLTKGMFAHRSFLNAYSLFLPNRLAEVVDRHMNCEDILFNMMAVGMTGLPPLAVMSNQTIHDAGKDQGISGIKGSGHLNVRDTCVQQFVQLGMDELTFISRGSVLPYGKKNWVVGGADDP